MAGTRIDVLDLSAKILLRKDAISFLYPCSYQEAYVKVYSGLVPCDLSG